MKSLFFSPFKSLSIPSRSISLNLNSHSFVDQIPWKYRNITINLNKIPLNQHISLSNPDLFLFNPIKIPSKSHEITTFHGEISPVSSCFSWLVAVQTRFVAPFSAEDWPVALPGRPHLGRPLSAPDGGQRTRSDGRTVGCWGKEGMTFRS